MTTMKVQIKETGKFEELTTIDPKTGIDYSGDLIGNHGGFMDDQFELSENKDFHICDQETYEWWNKVLNDIEELAIRSQELEEEHGREAVDKVIKSVDAPDLEYGTAVINGALDEAFK
jgi:hypothetical protein